MKLFNFLKPKDMKTTKVGDLLIQTKPSRITYQGKSEANIKRFKEMREQLKERSDFEVSSVIVADFNNRLNDDSLSEFKRKFLALKVLKGALV